MEKKELKTERSPWILWLLILFSLGFHSLLLIWAYAEYKKKNLWSDDKTTETSVLATRVLSPSEFSREVEKSRHIVQSQQAPELINKKDPAKYLGERTQRVEKESVAEDFGSVQGGKRGKKVILPEKTSELEKLGLSGGVGSSVLIPQKKKEERGDEGDGVLKKGSMDLLDKEVAIGSGTILNTDEYLYASFFNRLKDELGPRWEPLIQLILSSKRKLEAGFYRTEVLFSLDQSGDVTNVDIKESCGYPPFDDAAMSSVRQMGRIKNPPSGLRQANGSYRVQIGFVVNLGGGGHLRMNYEPDPRFR